jgi:hypothetical protein
MSIIAPWNNIWASCHGVSPSTGTISKRLTFLFLNPSLALLILATMFISANKSFFKCGDLTFMPGTPIASDASLPLLSPHSQSALQQCPSARSQIPIVTLNDIKQA